MGLGIKTAVVSRLKYYTRDRSVDFADDYVQWRAKRIVAILNHYGPGFFFGKTLMELGAGFGDTGAMFSTIGAEVFCVEGRESNTRVIRKRAPRLTALTYDVNIGIPDVVRKLDILIHMGVLYHLRDPEASIRASCKACEHLVLETECSDSDDPNFTTAANEPAYRLDQSLDGIGSRPSPAFVERVMREEGMQFQMIMDTSCNWGEAHYDWPIKNTKTFKNGQRRLWFAKKG